MRILHLTILLSLLAYPLAFAQEGKIELRDPKELQMISEPSGAFVYIRDSLVGKTPMKISLAQGWDSLLLVYPSPMDWNAVTKKIALPKEPLIGAGIVVRLPVKFLIQSQPYGASVHLRDSLIGVTPCIFTLQDEACTLTVEKNQYQKFVLPVGRLDNPNVSIALKPLVPEEQEQQVQSVRSAIRIPKTSVLVSGALGLATGITGILLKDRANNFYDEYRSTGNSEKLSETRRYDIYAGVALGLMQACFGYLVYLLLTE